LAGNEWPRKAPGFCCAGGKVLLNKIAYPLEPLNSLNNNKHDYSKVFLDNTRKYNSALQIMSFCVTEIRHGNFTSNHDPALSTNTDFCLFILYAFPFQLLERM